MTASGRLAVLLLLAAIAAGCASSATLPPPALGAPRGCWNPDPGSTDARRTFFLFCLQSP